MKVDNPRFSSSTGYVACEDCPFADEDGDGLDGLCPEESCPDANSYDSACRVAEACALAEKEAPDEKR